MVPGDGVKGPKNEPLTPSPGLKNGGAQCTLLKQKEYLQKTMGAME